MARDGLAPRGNEALMGDSRVASGGHRSLNFSPSWQQELRMMAQRDSGFLKVERQRAAPKPKASVPSGERSQVGCDGVFLSFCVSVQLGLRGQQCNEDCHR